ncbi:helix-turn-helix domain-containing protein [Ligilactobacillus aviarius]|uniref:Insertion element IS150 protein InsJ-like helix-turn-helix domain-containing protein n=2 Tax=Ligilactobacillus aviarius TaxID=1606 RepID=A0A179CRE6_9LACO|nr:helix-turn-helix domain-containing protein [Ligilactobacillus aviarius]OAP97578.1 hypothetical protein A3O07_07780 [Ligilactobacillus aviarius]OAP98240.1 hypothetical protein A3O08_06775 [Ligilactobacillus aviarius]OAP98243.1 hypothetical protein A3O09_07700 [Ligilactobacillus aviarius]OAQ05934.1 hypothetical protein A3O13_02825 [Ligilactobacillus aviarius]OAQ07443.1 hypothetical protein A3O14_05930 [Ligilactobacillus aviarius]
MVKYSLEMKKQIVKEAINGSSYCSLARKYDVDKSNIIDWCKLVQQHGTNALIHEGRRTFSINFKIHVVQDYISSSVGFRKIAAKYNISKSQVCAWYHSYETFGIAGLRPHAKRSSHTMSSTKKSKLILFEKNKDKKIAQLEAKLKHLEMERDILKTLLTLNKSTTSVKRK